MSHKCNSCEDVFTYKEARYDPIYEFELSEETKRTVAKGTLPLASIISTLKENGFEVGSKRDLLGKSGATHTFDIVARKGGSLVVGNFAFEPKEEDIIGLFAKKYDVDPTFTLLIALTTPTKDEETVSKAYGVQIVYPTGSSSIGKQIVELVDSKFQGNRGLPEVQPKIDAEPQETNQQEPRQEKPVDLKDHETIGKSKDEESRNKEEIEEVPVKEPSESVKGSSEEGESHNSNHGDWDSENF